MPEKLTSQICFTTSNLPKTLGVSVVCEELKCDQDTCAVAQECLQIGAQTYVCATHTEPTIILQFSYCNRIAKTEP